MDEELRNRLDFLEGEVITQELRTRLNYLEGEVVALETLTADLLAALVYGGIVDVGRLRRVIEEHIKIFTIRQHDDLILGTPGEHYFKGAVRALEIVEEKLPK